MFSALIVIAALTFNTAPLVEPDQMNEVSISDVIRRSRDVGSL